MGAGRLDDRIDRIVLIFNPHSTGPAPQLAEELRAELSRRLPQLPVGMAPTRYAGHARELAREAAGTGRPLIVSVSGDGGYNEVVDGAMKSGNKDVVCAVLGAGNANDHRRATGRRPLAQAIEAGDIRHIDLLRLTIGTGQDAEIRYAHSYVGLGITPVVAVDLERGGKGSFREIVAVVRTFARFRPFELELDDGTVSRYDSLVFANINEMAKYATLSEDGRPDDGRFEVIGLRHTAKSHVLGVALKAAFRGLGPQPRATHFGLVTREPAPLQLDGELVELDAGTRVCVEIAPGALATVS